MIAELLVPGAQDPNNWEITVNNRFWGGRTRIWGWDAASGTNKLGVDQDRYDAAVGSIDFLSLRVPQGDSSYCWNKTRYRFHWKPNTPPPTKLMIRLVNQSGYHGTSGTFNLGLPFHTEYGDPSGTYQEGIGYRQISIDAQGNGYTSVEGKASVSLYLSPTWPFQQYTAECFTELSAAVAEQAVGITPNPNPSFYGEFDVTREDLKYFVPKYHKSADLNFTEMTAGVKGIESPDSTENDPKFTASLNVPVVANSYGTWLGPVSYEWSLPATGIFQQGATPHTGTCAFAFAGDAYAPMIRGEAPINGQLSVTTKELAPREGGFQMPEQSAVLKMNLHGDVEAYGGTVDELQQQSKSPLVVNGSVVSVTVPVAGERPTFTFNQGWTTVHKPNSLTVEGGADVETGGVVEKLAGKLKYGFKVELMHPLGTENQETAVLGQTVTGPPAAYAGQVFIAYAVKSWLYKVQLSHWYNAHGFHSAGHKFSKLGSDFPVLQIVLEPVA